MDTLREIQDVVHGQRIVSIAFMIFFANWFIVLSVCFLEQEMQLKFYFHAFWVISAFSFLVVYSRVLILFHICCALPYLIFFTVNFSFLGLILKNMTVFLTNRFTCFVFQF